MCKPMKDTADDAPPAFPKDKADDAPPAFPYRAVLLLLLTNLTEPIVMAILFPMAPFMVADWVSADEVGSWAGLLTSAYNIASIPASIFWGRLSDRVGRKPCMTALLVGSAACIVGFGLSGSLAQAMCMRCLGGLFSGMTGLVLAAMRDITTDSQRAKAVSSISFAYGIGFAIGPMIGGGLIHPADTMPFLRGSLLETFPYLLPCIVCALLILVSGVGLFWLHLPRKPKAVAAADASPATASSPPPTTTSSTTTTSTSTSSAEPTDDARDGPATAVELASHPDAGTEESMGAQLFQGPGSGGGRGGGGGVPGGCRRRCARRLREAASPIVMLLCAYFLTNLGITGVSETWPLFVARNGTSGLSLPPYQVGEAMLPQSAIVLCMPLAYPLIAKRAGDKGSYLTGAVATVVFSVATPFLRYLKETPAAMWAGLSALSGCRGIVGPLVFPANIILMNKVITERFGFWNGLGSSVAATAKAVAPFLFGHLFSIGVSVGHAPFPFDVSMPFLIAAIAVAGAGAIIASVRVPGKGGGAAAASADAPGRARTSCIRRLSAICWAPPASARTRTAPAVQLPSLNGE